MNIKVTKSLLLVLAVLVQMGVVVLVLPKGARFAPFFYNAGWALSLGCIAYYLKG